MSQAQNIGIFSEFLDALDDFNKRFFRTVKDLILRPKVVTDIMLPDNHNRQYVNPFRFALLIFSFYTFCIALLDLNMANIGSAFTEQKDAEDLALTYRVFDSAVIFMSFIYLIPCAWLVAKIFPNSNLTSFGCYKISLYGFALANLMELLITAPIKLLFFDLSIENSALLLQTTTMVAYVFVIRVYSGCFSTGYWEGIWKSMVVVVFSFIIAVLTAAALTVAVGIYEGYNEAAAEHALEQAPEKIAITEQTDQAQIPVESSLQDPPSEESKTAEDKTTDMTNTQNDSQNSPPKEPEKKEQQ